jgi:hypothetical protein
VPPPPDESLIIRMVTMLRQLARPTIRALGTCAPSH